jgi:hypothetical protein
MPMRGVLPPCAEDVCVTEDLGCPVSGPYTIGPPAAGRRPSAPAPTPPPCHAPGPSPVPFPQGVPRVSATERGLCARRTPARANRATGATRRGRETAGRRPPVTSCRPPPDGGDGALPARSRLDPRSSRAQCETSCAGSSLSSRSSAAPPPKRPDATMPHRQRRHRGRKKPGRATPGGRRARRATSGAPSDAGPGDVGPRDVGSNEGETRRPEPGRAAPGIGVYVYEVVAVEAGPAMEGRIVIDFRKRAPKARPAR